MFADPITVTINAVAKQLVRINQDNYSSEYLLRESDREFRLKIRNTSSSRAGVVYSRHSVELTERIYAVGATPEVNRKSYTTFEHSNNDTGAALQNTVKGQIDFLTAANIGKLLNSES